MLKTSDDNKMNTSDDNKMNTSDDNKMNTKKNDSEQIDLVEKLDSCEDGLDIFKTKLTLHNMISPEREMNNLYGTFLNEWSHNFIQFILDNLDKPWDFHALSTNPNITFDIVKANPNIPWNYNLLSANSNITLKIIKDNSDIRWDNRWDPWSLSSNPNITFNHIITNSDIEWGATSNIKLDIS